MGVHPEYSNALSGMVKFLFALLLIQLVAWLLPAWPNSKGIPNYIPWHDIMEAISIVISMMVFAVGWNSKNKNLSGNVVLLASVFFSVGVIDFFHTVTYVGMPEFFSPNDAQKHLNYWLSARLLAAIVLLVIVVREWKPLVSRITRYIIFSSLLIFTLSLNWAVTYHQNWFPDTFIPGQGLTPFKKNFEYLIILINLVTAGILLGKMRKPQPYKIVMLFGAVCTLTMSEYFFTIYTTMLGSYNILGHIYKVIAYLLLYRAIVVEVIEDPYNLLEIAKNELAESETRFRHILEQAPIGIVTNDFEGHFIKVNEAFSRMLGYAKEELEALSFQDVSHPDDKTLSYGDRQKLLDGAIVSYQLVKRYIHRDGHVVWGQLTSSVEKDIRGEPFFIAQVEDITERKQAADALQHSRDIFQAIQLSITESIFLLDINGIVLAINPTAAQRLGKRPNEVMGQNVFNFFPAEVADARRTIAEEVFRTIQPKTFEDARNGKVFSSSYYPVISAQGQCEAVVVVGTDITERKQAEQLVHQSNKEKQQILESTGEGIYGIDTEGHCIFANSAASRMLGFEVSEMIGKDMHALIHHHHKDGSPYLVNECHIYKAFRAGEFIKNDSEVFWRKDQTPVPVEYLSSPMKDKGIITGAVITFSDITRRKQDEMELHIAATAFESQEGISVTDANGIILRVNQAFTTITGYSAEEVIGKNPRMFKSGRQDASFYVAMWEKINNTGFWEGDIWNRRKNGEIYPEYLTITAVKGSDGFVSNYVATLTDITLTKAAEDEIKHLAFYDPLTLLPNRRLLLDRLRQALASIARSGQTGALLFIDLDNFKTLNDTLGHDIGDLLLQQVAKRLESCVREGDTVARLGGDEFVVMLEDLSKNSVEAAEQTETIGRKILLSLNQTYQLASHEHHNTPSIGATLFRDHSQPIDDLMKQADIAMYQSKKAGRNTLRFFDPQMQEAVDARAILEADLRKALEKNELEVFYQPIVDCKTGKIHKAEALLRWKHPTRGMISPATFIPLAEELGLILEIGEWVFMQAINTIEHWRNETGRIIQVSVNKSPVQFVRAEQHPWLERLANSELPENCIAVEITEGLLITDSDKIRDELLSFQKRGIEVSIDDFGTGFSALSYLNQFDIDYLKIDISFIRSIVENESNRALTEAIIVMAHKLGIKTIAEGVETEAQRDLLIQFGCDYIQGFLYSKPVTATEFMKLIRN